MRDVLLTVLGCWLALGFIGALMFASVSWSDTGKKFLYEPIISTAMFAVAILGGAYTFAYGFLVRVLMSLCRGH